MRLVLIACVISLLFAFAAFSSTVALPNELTALRDAGTKGLFENDYAEARRNFEKMTVLDPRHPAGYIYLANTVWLQHLNSLRRLQAWVYNKDNSFFSETDDIVNPRVDKEFRTAISKGISLAEARLKSRSNDIDSLYYLGMARIVMAGYEATVKRSFLSSLRNASKGVSLHQKVLTQDPAFIDANLSIGIFNYVVGSLPLAVKILIFFGGVHGSRKEGLKRVELVANNGTTSRDEAKVMLVMLYDREKRVEESLELLKEQSARFPHNYLYRLQMGTTLVELQKYEESFKVFEQLLMDPTARSFVEDLIHYQYAEALFYRKAWRDAHQHYVLAGQCPKAPESLITMAHLGAGKCQDRMGNRAEALAEYKTVLNRKNVFDSHKLARQYVKKPPRATEN